MNRTMKFSTPCPKTALHAVSIAVIERPGTVAPELNTCSEQLALRNAR